MSQSDSPFNLATTRCFRPVMYDLTHRTTDLEKPIKISLRSNLKGEVVSNALLSLTFVHGLFSRRLWKESSKGQSDENSRRQKELPFS